MNPGPPQDEGEHGPPVVVDELTDVFGAEDAVRRLVARLRELQPSAVRVASGGEPLLTPPVSADRDRLQGGEWTERTLLVFGAYGTPASRPLARLLDEVRRRHPADLALAWRHFPDPAAHPRATILALAAEAAAAEGRFWALHDHLLHLRHDDPVDLHAAMLQASLDPDRVTALMRAGTGADRIVDDVSSALASGVLYSPWLFVDGESYRGELTVSAVTAALDAP